MPKSKSYAEKWRIWSRQQELERQHEAYKQYRIEEYNRRKMSELRNKDRQSGKSSHRRGRQSRSKSRSRERSREIRLSDSQLKTLEALLRKDLFRKIDAISEGREDTESQTRTGDRRPRKTDRKHSSREPGRSHDRRDSQPSTSTRHPDVESSRCHRSRSRSRNRSLPERGHRSPPERVRRSPTERHRRSSTERVRRSPPECVRRTPPERVRRSPPERDRRSRSPVRPPTENRDLIPTRPQTRSRSPTQSRPRSPSRDRYRDSRLDQSLPNRDDQYRSTRHRDASSASKPADGPPSRTRESNRSPRENRDYSRYRRYPTQRQRWQHSLGPYTDYYRGPPPFPVVRHPNWQNIPAPMHYGYIWPPTRPQLPPPPYRGPYPPYGPGPNFHGYQ